MVKASFRTAVKESATAPWTRLISFVMREMIRPVGVLSKKARGCSWRRRKTRFLMSVMIFWPTKPMRYDWR